jgi:hypothetical protein
MPFRIRPQTFSYFVRVSLDSGLSLLPKPWQVPQSMSLYYLPDTSISLRSVRYRPGRASGTTGSGRDWQGNRMISKGNWIGNHIGH